MGDRVDILRRIEVCWDTVDDRTSFPFSLPVLRTLDRIEFPTPVTFLAGENGAGKSTLTEAIALGVGLSPEGGNRDIRLALHGTESLLADHLRLVYGTRPRTAFFLRAETWLSTAATYNGLMQRDLARSHGEQVIEAITSRLFQPGGLYVMDEPESGLSFLGQLQLMRQIHELVEAGSQIIAATHSPVLLAYPGATIYTLGDNGIDAVAYADTEAYQLTRSFLDAPSRFLAPLLD